MIVALPDEKALGTFERGVIGLIGGSLLQRADYLLKQAIAAHGSPDLRAVVEGEAGIDGWDELCAGMAEVDRRFRDRDGGEVAMARLSLINRNTGGEPEALTIAGEFFDSAELGDHGRPMGLGLRSAERQAATVLLTGVDALAAIQRRKSPPGDIREAAGFAWRIDTTLAGLLLILRYHQAVDRCLAGEGLPLAVALVIETDQADWPMEVGIHDFGPFPRRHVARVEPSPAALDAAGELKVERDAENRLDFQRTWEKTFAEYREIHRMLGYFPFYRASGRNELADLWASRLDMACDILELDPRPKLSWRMTAGDLTEVLRRLAEARNVPDPAAAIDPAHTDRLHAKWLAIAKAQDFELGAGVSLFQLQLAAALRKGGPWVHDRWEHAKPYAEER